MQGVALQVSTEDGTVTVGQQGHRCCKKDGGLTLESLVNGSYQDLGLAGAGLSQEHTVLAPGRILLGSRVKRLVQECLALCQVSTISW